MPIVDLDPQPLDSPVTAPEKAFVTPGLDDVVEKPVGAAPTLGERALGAAAGVFPGGSLLYRTVRSPAFAPSMRRDNLLASVWSSESAWTDRTPDPDFNPYEHIKGTKYENYPEAFEGVFNGRQYVSVIRDIDREESDRKLLDGLPLHQTLPAALLANVLDPTVLLPGGAFVRGAKGGFSMARTAGSVGLAAGGATAVQEAGLQAIQETRPFSESAINIGSSILLGGLLGWGGAALLSPREMASAIAKVDQQLGVTGSDAATIIEDIKPKLLATGMSEEEASANAAIVAARYMTRAERLGEGASDLYRAEMADVRGAGAVTGDEVINPARQFFQQEGWLEKLLKDIGRAEPTVAASEMRPRAQMVDPDALEWNLYHGTSAGEFSRFDPDARARGPASPEQGAVFFTPSAHEAENYGDQIIRVRVIPGRTKVFDLRDLFENDEAFHGEIRRALREQAQAKGRSIADADAAYERQRDFAMQSFDRDREVMEMARREGVPESEIKPWNVPYSWGGVDAAIRIGRREGYDTIIIRGLDESGGGDQIAVLNPERVFSYYTGQKLFQIGETGPRGRITLSENKAIIDLFSKADQSTFMHEAGHLWLEELVRDAARANVPQAIRDDLGTVLRWLKVDKVEDIGRAQHEQWAKAFEQYLAEGKAPSNALAQAFEKFKQWLTAIYKSLTEIGSPLSDDVRGVMDRMLATDAEIAQRGIPQGAVANSVGAAAVMAPSLANTQIAGRAAGAAAYATAKLNPGLRIAHSESAEARNVGFNLFEMAQYIKGNEDGFASPIAVETFRKQWDAGLGTAVRETNLAYRDYRKAGGQLSRTDFQAEVGKAMRRGDDSPIPEVAKVAQAWRREVFDPLKQAAIESDLLPPDVSVDTAISYFSRLWNRKRLVAEEGQFKQVVVDWVDRNMPQWAKAYDRQTERRLEPLRREIADLEMAKLRRASELKERGDEIDPENMTESDVRQAIRIVQGGAAKPKGVETLTQFIRNQGGLVEDGGELRHMGINNKTMPGFIRTTKRRRGPKNKISDGGWDTDAMAVHAWENGFFPEHQSPPTRVEFLDALSDDFSRRRAVVRLEDRDAFHLVDLVNRLEDDLARVGVDPAKGARFSTSEEVKGVVKRVYAALDAEADANMAALRKMLSDREIEARTERDARMFDDPREAGRAIADEVFDTLTGRTAEGPRPEFLTIKAQGPLKERTFNIPDELIERWLESDIDLVGRRYTRVMSADVELARKFGAPDMEEAIGKVREDYNKLRAGVTDERRLTKLAKQEKSDIDDLRAVRDLIRGNFAQAAWEHDFGAIVRMANATQYILKMGQVVLSSLTEPVRVVAAKGLTPFMRDAFAGMANSAALKLSIAEARQAGNVLDKVLAARLSTVADLTDFYSSRGPVEKFLDNMTNVASTWNGIRLWTDGVKMLASTTIQNKILDSVGRFAELGANDKRYLNFLGIDESMAGRIAQQFAEHGSDAGGIRVAGTANWTDDVARRSYRAALNKDLDSMVVTRGAADLPLFANTPLGKLLFQFNTFNLASHQRVLLRGLQEGHARFLSGVIALSSMGMLQTYLAALATNSYDKLPDMRANPGWWISEGLDKSGFFSIPMQIANGVEKLTGINPVKAPIKFADEGRQGSQKNRNRNELGLLGPSAGTLQDIGTVAGIPRNVAAGEDVSQAQKNAAERLLPYNSYVGIRQLLKFFLNPPDE